MKILYEKIINLLDIIPNHPSKFKTKNWVERNARSHGVQSNQIQIIVNIGSQIKFQNFNAKVKFM